MEDVRDYSDGYTEAWYLPAARDLPAVTPVSPKSPPAGLHAGSHLVQNSSCLSSFFNNFV